MIETCARYVHEFGEAVRKWAEVYTTYRIQLHDCEVHGDSESCKLMKLNRTDLEGIETLINNAGLHLSNCLDEVIK